MLLWFYFYDLRHSAQTSESLIVVMDIFETIVIAIVEGLTEFLPVSSTGHMIIAQNLLGVESTEFVKAFTFIIQFGAILSVLVL